MKKILVLSHERSGTHFLINTIAQNFGYSPNQIDMDNSQNIDWKDTSAASNWLRQMNHDPSRGILKSHHSYAFFEPILESMLDEFHIFYIMRDGRDVMTSFWVYLNRLAPGWGPHAATVGEFMRSRAAGGITQYQYHARPLTMLQRWVEHTVDWVHAPGDIHRLRYEDLHGDFGSTLDRISDVLGQTPDTQNRPSLESPSSLPWKGTTGTWKDYFSDADKHYFRVNTPNRDFGDE